MGLAATPHYIDFRELERWDVKYFIRTNRIEISLGFFCPRICS